MERKNTGIDPRVAELVRRAENILSEPERVYDLVGRRLALRCVELEASFSLDAFRLGVVGNPNRGKTTLAYSYYRALEIYGFPTAYFDLDIYSYSGLAISGEVDWEKRPKRSDAPQKEVEESILAFREAGPGIVIGDFPGRVDNLYQLDRLKTVDLAIILGVSIDDRRGWQELIGKSGVSALWLRSQLDKTPSYPLDPTLYGLDREPKPADLDVLTSLTRILEVVAKMKGVSLSSPWPLFTEAERLILEEVLDFNFAPLA